MLDKYGVKHTLGTFYLTETHFIFMEPNGKKKIWVNFLSKSHKHKFHKFQVTDMFILI